MATSVYAEACNAARDAAAQLGHTLERWHVRSLMARASCTVCSCSAVVRCYDAVAVDGAALTEACKRPEANVAPAPVAPKPSGAAKRAPRPAQLAPASVPGAVLGDVPWPGEELAPARDALVTR
jgi:hypothetical protein